MITALNGKKSEIQTDMSQATFDIQTNKEDKDKAASAYKERFEEDDKMLKIHKADLAVTQFMLDVSKCKDADYTASFIQNVEALETTGLEVCTENGTASFRFL